MFDTETKFDLYPETYQISDGTLVYCQIMDTGGQEKYDSINKQYYRRADCCVLVYDITNKDSFDAIEKFYVNEMIQNCKKNINVILVGNKADLKDKRTISSEDGTNLANKYHFFFQETSCEYNFNVADAFETIITMTHTDMLKSGEYKNKEENNNIKLENDEKDDIETNNNNITDEGNNKIITKESNDNNNITDEGNNNIITNESNNNNITDEGNNNIITNESNDNNIISNSINDSNISKKPKKDISKSNKKKQNQKNRNKNNGCC